ncbi:hypothetical protein [Paenibacillus alginolyticus]|uniref:MucB/RseB N-terminal domain-containing protein n=1 Tax=Paenibacillus alginolyticus TaxID=59839 RepID=A0ABT4G7H5_9BACL|nr:hypothetical protein [Paenibacillus alginolyticus]MCY9692131.1 hypothetical protein [Paenibacillus alginolyticus]MEC0147897.1 hypothetical protein [Paenibacillus alginolyticus]
MKTPDPDDLHKQLESGPLKQSGFTSKLQGDIEEAIERKERAKPKVKPLLCFAGLGAIAAAILLFPWSTIHTQSDAAPAMDASVTTASASTSSSPAPISTALLIGLRTERESNNTEAQHALGPIRYSTYRTMLIAPVRGQLQKTSEGRGILMPYKQNFWKIDSLVHKTKTDEVHYLSAHLADQPVKPEVFPDQADEQLNRVETLVFAGNQYVSIAESEEAWRGNAPYQAERIWVRTLPQLKEGHTVQFYNKPVDKNHVSLTDLYSSSISSLLPNVPSSSTKLLGEITGQSWTVQREPGRWVGKIAETPRNSPATPDSYVLHDFPRELPDKVINHDDLCCSWSAIQSSWPLATDALTSPMNDMIVIFENGKLKFYPYGQAPGNAPQLSIDLQPGEKLVMAQWATDHYVQEWIDKVGRYLNNDQVPLSSSDEVDNGKVVKTR